MGEVDEYVWRGGGQSVRGETVGDADGVEAGVSAGFNVDVGVADDGGLMRRRAGFFEQFEGAFGIGLFGGETIAAVDLREKRSEAEGFDDGARGDDGFVGEHGHFSRRAVGGTLDGGEGVTDSVVDGGVVEFVFAVVGEKKLQSLAKGCFVDGIAAESALDEDWCAVADIAGDDVVGEGGTSDVAEGGVDGMHEIEARVDQGAIEVKDDKLDGGGIECSAGLDHVLTG